MSFFFYIRVKEKRVENNRVQRERVLKFLNMHTTENEAYTGSYRGIYLLVGYCCCVFLWMSIHFYSKK